MIGSIIKIVRPLSSETDVMVDDFAYQPLVQPLYEAIYPRLSAHDIDQVSLYCFWIGVAWGVERCDGI